MLGSELFARIVRQVSRSKCLQSLDQGFWSKVQRAVMRARAFFLRFGTSIHRGSVVRAYEKFLSLWLEEFEENSMPSVGTLCALVIAHQHLPSKGDVAEAEGYQAMVFASA